MVKGLSMAHLKHKIEQLFQSGKEGPDIQELNVSGTSTYKGNEVLKADYTNNNHNLSFNTWRQPSVDRPSLVALSIKVKTDGTSSGYVRAKVDEDGDQAGDFIYNVRIGSDNAANAFITGSMTIYVPPGGSYYIDNFSDPTGSNQITLSREFNL